ncbi:MAG: NeuD/PglB/VioB family sugar acetyltransferase [Bernardetiaceae bacterium]|nr:NeuD/PglB/VioB family sugar acetyltransferase [Bernardetiaceae bacterium]
MIQKKKQVLIIGGQGSGSVLGDTIVDANKRGDMEYEFVGFINDRDQQAHIGDKPVLGGLDDVPKFVKQGYHFVYSIYKFDDQPNRIRLFESLNIPHDQLVTFVHPTAYIAPNVELAHGVFIMANVSITSNTKLGLNCIIRPGTTIGHDNVIEDHVSITAGASVGSCIHIKRGASVGLKACIREYLSIGENSMLAMGAVLTKNLPANELWAGNPARLLRQAKWLS